MKNVCTAVLLLLPACLDADPMLGVETSAIVPTGCPKWGCNENSPVMGQFGYFHELHPAGVPNVNGMIVTGFRFEPEGKLYKPRIVDGTRIVVDYPAENVTLSGTQLTGGWFQIQSATTGLTYRLFIDHVTPLQESEVGFWLGNPDPIETYELAWQGPTEPFGPKRTALCNHAPQRSSGEPAHLWLAPYEAFIFTGDRYDADAKTVTSIDDTSGFFNIACAGSAIAKLHLNRHTTAGSPGPNAQTTTRAQRQAMLKMYVSDVCGSGNAWTRKGTPLHWENTLGWSHLDHTEYAHEALWTDRGAVCLDTHRLGSLYQNDWSIYADCASVNHPLPTCPNRPPSRVTPYLSSAVPVKP